MPAADRHAGRRAAHQDREHARLWRRDRALRPRTARAAKASPQRLGGERGATLVPPVRRSAALSPAKAPPALEAIEDAAALGVDVRRARRAGERRRPDRRQRPRLRRPAVPDTAIYAAEPVGLDDHARSLARHERVGHDADGAKASATRCWRIMPGEITFAINRRRLAGGLAVSDDEARAAMRVAFTELKTGAGAVGRGGAGGGAAAAHPGHADARSASSPRAAMSTPAFYAEVLRTTMRRGKATPCAGLARASTKRFFLGDGRDPPPSFVTPAKAGVQGR